MDDPIATRGLMTAHQAALLVGIPVSTFNYHLRKGHITVAARVSGWATFVSKADAERFARKLKQWQRWQDDFDWLSDDDPQELCPHCGKVIVPDERGR